MNKLLRFWTGPLPKEELYPTDRQTNPLLHWFYHPLKRHLARNYLRFLQKFCGLKVIGIAGSNGKTTTRSLLLTALSPLATTIATKDSVTPTYNIPSSILRLKPWTKYFICEMSVEYLGDMAFYRWLVTPNIAIMTLIDMEHTLYLGTTSQVAAEENHLLTSLPKSSLAIINGNSAQITQNTRAKLYTFGTSDIFDCYIKSSRLTANFQTEISLNLNHSNFNFTLPVLGTHLAHPVASVLLTCHLLNYDLNFCIKNLQTFSPPPHRANVIHLSSGAVVIDDTYNANPSSTVPTLKTAVELANLTKRNLIVVISQMNELGQYEASEHQKISQLLKKLPVKKLYVLGAAAKIYNTSLPGSEYFSSSENLLSHFKSFKFTAKDLILIKSSRGWKLENLVRLLQDS